MSFDKNFIKSLASLFIIVCAMLIWREVFLPLDATPGRIVEFSVQKGDLADKIALNLEQDGLIRRNVVFRFLTRVLGTSNKMQSGRYDLSSNMSIWTIANKIAHGDIAKVKITIFEGWTLKDLANYFAEKNICSVKEFERLAEKDYNGSLTFLADKPKDADLEGYLFPDTYEIGQEPSAENVVQKILTNFDEKLTPELREEIKKQKKTVFEIITMASIIEKEVKGFNDKKTASGVLWKRIKIGMPLQVDSTINYITGKNHDGAMYEDLEIDSPYNTYMYKGLPKGPISNPGMESILAAIYPAKTDYLYYLSTPNGRTIFSKTFKDHNLARQRYGV